MVKESLSSPIKPPIFKETFRDESTTRSNGGTPTAVTYSNGVGTFDGSNSKLSYKPTSTTNFSNEDFTAVLVATITGGESLFGRKNSIGDNNAGWIMYRSGTNIYAKFSDGSGSTTTTSSSTINDGVKHCIVMVRASNVVSFYVDGVSVNTPTANTRNTYITDKGIGLGADYAGSSKSVSVIELAEIYDYALSAEEVESMYNGEYYKDTNRGLIGEWKLGRKDETLGSDLASGWDFTNWTTTASATVDNATQFTTSVGANGIYKEFSLVEGKTYSVSFAGSADNGSTVGIYAGLGGAVITGLGGAGAGFDSTATFVYTSTGASDIYIRYNTTGQVTITKLTVQEIQANDSGGQSDTGAELITNSNFVSDVSSWTKASADETSTMTHNVADEAMNLAVTSAGTNGLRPSITGTMSPQLISGKKYKVTISYRVNSGTCVLARYFDGSGTITLNKTFSGTNSYTFEFVATGASNLILYFNGTSVFDVDMFNVSVRQYTGDGWITAPNNGSLYNFPATIPYTTGPFGFADTALTFTTNDYIDIPDAAELSFGNGTSDEAFSISAWVNMTDASNFKILSKGVYNTDNGEYLFTIESDDKIKFYLFDNSAPAYVGRVYDTALTNYEGQWIHLVGTYDGRGGATAEGGINIYLNGNVVDNANDKTGTYVAMENLTHAMWIGRYSTNYSEGSIADVKIIKRELGAQEVRNIYKEAMRGINK